MPEISEMQRAVRVLLLDVMEQCARNVDACPQARSRFERIARSAHDYLVRFETQSAAMEKTGLSQRGLYTKAQDRVLEWLLEMQDIRRDYPLRQSVKDMTQWTEAGVPDEFRSPNLA